MGWADGVQLVFAAVPVVLEEVTQAIYESVKVPRNERIS